MLAKMTWSAFSGRIGWRPLRKTCGRAGSVHVLDGLERERNRAHLDDKLQALHVALLGRDELVARLLPLALRVRKVDKRRFVDEARPGLQELFSAQQRQERVKKDALIRMRR